MDVMNYLNQWNDVNQQDINELPEDLDDYSDLSSETGITMKMIEQPVSMDSLGLTWRDFF